MVGMSGGSDVVLGRDDDRLRVPQGNDFLFGSLRRSYRAAGDLLVETAVAAHAGSSERVRRVRAVRVPGLSPRAHGALEDEVAERPKQARDDEHADGYRDKRDDIVASRRPAVIIVIPTTVSRLVGGPRRRLLSQGQVRSG